jgi:hydrocephalus-inducing protein
MYDDIAVAAITLHNTGKVGFEFTALGMDPSLEEKPRPGVPVMIPHTVSTNLSKICNSK